MQPSSGAAGTTVWPTIRWASGFTPTLTTTNSKADVVSLLYVNSEYYGGTSLNY